MKIARLFKRACVLYMRLPLRRRVLYTATFVLWHILLLVVSIFGNRLQSNLGPLATKMEQTKVAWLPLSVLIALVSIPPLFGHEILAVIAGYVYGAALGFSILAISSIIGESVVYFTFRTLLRGHLNRLRQRFSTSYGVFVAVVEDGGIFMLWLIRMSIIPPHFSTPLFSSLDNVTLWKWMIANIAASPVKFYPPVFIGTLLRDQRKNSLVGDFAFGISIFITMAVLWTIRRKYIEKKESLRRQAQDEEQGPGVISSTSARTDEEKGEEGAGLAADTTSRVSDERSITPGLPSARDVAVVQRCSTSHPLASSDTQLDAGTGTQDSQGEACMSRSGNVQIETASGLVPEAYEVSSGCCGGAGSVVGQDDQGPGDRGTP